MKNDKDAVSHIRSWNSNDDMFENFNPSKKTIIKSAKIALIDTGVTTKHPCFENARLIAKDFTGGSNPVDEIGHGTHCAGLIIAQKNSGLTGLCPSAMLYSAKVLGKAKQNKATTERAIAKAIEWAIVEDVHIILITLGCQYESKVVKNSIENAVQHEIKIIASAGNHAGSLPLFPANMPQVICVSALGKNGLPLPECYQGELVDVFIPGESIRSASINGWHEMSGSSQAAAIFCGHLAKKITAKPNI